MKRYTKSEFDNLRVFERNSPKYRGAPYPEFKVHCINEKNIPDGMRFKEYNIDFNEEAQEVRIDWITQEDFRYIDFLNFVDEVKRCANDTCPNAKFKICIDVRDRDCTCHEFDIYRMNECK